LTALHHRSDRGAHEEVAFPGFTTLALVLLPLFLPVRQLLRAAGYRAASILAGRWIVILALGFVATLFSHSVLAGIVFVALAAWFDSRRSQPFTSPSGLYWTVLVLSVLLFLGLELLQFQGAPVRGLYYYFHTYFPGFNGIRKVSRQAVMTTFVFAVLASFGSAWLFARLNRPGARWLLLAGLLVASGYELRCFPHPMRNVWAGAAVPEAYRFLATLPKQDLVAVVPQNTGVGLFRWDHGLALHNYLMLFHKHRSLNGQSSWQPPVTELATQALQSLPDAGARRILQSLQLRHLLIHDNELEPSRRGLATVLISQPEHYRRVFQDGGDSVFTLVEPNFPTSALTEMPALPSTAQLIATNELSARANLEGRSAGLALDGNAQTAWSGRVAQARGQGFEVSLKHAARIVAFEIENPWNLTHLPLSFELSVRHGDSAWQSVATQPELQVPRALVYSPKGFVLRVVVPNPQLADRLRLTLLSPVPGAPLTIHEARVYALP
jgi:hypothetical protein